MTFVEIEGKQGLIRDLNSGAILNTNVTEYENHIARRHQQREERRKIAQQENEINNIKQELSDIKQLLQALLRQNNG